MLYIFDNLLYLCPMEKDSLYQPFELVLSDFLEECPRKIHQHTFFEIVYIVSGTGLQTINNDTFSYSPGHLFLLAPEDEHLFRVDTISRFFFIRFNPLYLKSGNSSKELVNRLEMILRNATKQPGCVLREGTDKHITHELMKSLIREKESKSLFHKELITQYVNTLLVIIARNLSLSLPQQITENTDQKAVDILSYIQSNISNPEKLKATHIGQHFGISIAYLGRYFKKHTNSGLQDYIVKYKLKQVENRLLHSTMRISEIADEFGFADKSHLSKTFKKYIGINPITYRKNYLSAAHV